MPTRVSRHPASITERTSQLAEHVLRRGEVLFTAARTMSALTCQGTLILTMSTNPYAAPTPGRTSSLREVDAASIHADAFVSALEVDPKRPGPWQLAFGRDEMWLVPPQSHAAFVLTHGELAEHSTLFVTRAFVVLNLTGIPVRGKIALKLEQVASDALRTWMGQQAHVHIATALKKRLRYSLPLGIFFIATSLPLVTDRIDPFGLTVGAGLIALALAGKWRPRAEVFLLDGLVWFALAVNGARAGYAGSKLMIALTLFYVWLGIMSLRQLQFFRSLGLAAKTSA